MGRTLVFAACALALVLSVALTPTAAAIARPPAQQAPPGQQPAGDGHTDGWASGGSNDHDHDRDGSGGGASGGATHHHTTQPVRPATQQRPMYGQNGHGIRQPGPAYPPSTQYYESAPSVQEVEYHSYGENVGSSFGGAVFGVILFAAAHVLLFWNEGRTLRRETALAAAQGAVKELNPAQYDATLNGALVHAVHRIESADALEDDDIGLSGDHALVGALKLVRTVKLYQWVQKEKSRTEKQVGGGSRTITTYSYEKAWRDKPVDSSAFKNPPFPANPTRKPLEDLTKTARHVTFGVYHLSAAQIEHLRADESVALPAQAVTAALRRRGVSVGEGHISVQGNTVYLGNPSAPQIGDVRIEYHVATAQIVSVMAAQHDHSFAAYQSDATGSEAIDLLHSGSHTAAAMIASELDSNALVKWLLRAVGFVLMWIGLALTTGPLEAILNVLPFLGSIVSTLAGVMTFLICIPLTLLTVGIAWLYYRPRVGVVLLALACVAFYFVHVAAVATATGVPPPGVAAGLGVASAGHAGAGAGAGASVGAGVGRCGAQQKALDDCVKNDGLAQCQYYYDKLSACQKA